MSSVPIDVVPGGVVAAANSSGIQQPFVPEAQQAMFEKDTRYQILWNEHMQNSTKFVRYKRTSVLLSTLR